MSSNQPTEANFKAQIVNLILNKRTEEALELLSEHYNVDVPKLKVGLPKGHLRTAYGTYMTKTKTINVLDSEVFGNPFVILHEFYHHVRSKSVDQIHRGTEKNVNKFAIEFLQAFQVEAAKMALGLGT